MKECFLCLFVAEKCSSLRFFAMKVGDFEAFTELINKSIEDLCFHVDLHLLPL